MSINLLLKSAIGFLILASASLVEAQTIQTLCSFNSTNGMYPQAALTLGNDGNFYGTTTSGGGHGTVFKVTTNGTLTTLATFNGANGEGPWGGLTLGNDGNFYGTTQTGGSSNHGTVFKVTTNGTLTSLVSFNYTNGLGWRPQTALTLGNDGDFYGTTYYGGNINLNDGNGSGTVFKVTTNGVLTTLASFSNTNGASPQAALALGNDGNFYGTTWGGGSFGLGTVFKVTTNGALTTLVSFFNGTDGTRPKTGLTLGNDGVFYGTTIGTVFKVTTNGVLTTLVSFSNGNNSSAPDAGLTLGNDGNFYGVTVWGGDTSLNGGAGAGTVFKVTTNGTLTTLVSFHGTNGFYPNALTLGSGGCLYGTTEYGGASNNGVVFHLLLPPTITLQPQSQTNGVGATVTFVAGATSLTPMGYQWQKNGTNLVDGGNLSGAATNTLNITGISDSTAGTYSVVLTNADGSTASSNAVLTVNDLPVIASQPQSQAVLAGSNATFTITAYGSPPFVFQWLFNGAPFGVPTAGTGCSSLTLTNVGAGHAGNYRVEVINDYGSVTSSNAALTVVKLPPAITTQPASRTNNAGTTATFSVVASLSPLAYQWQKNATNLANGGNISGATNSTLTITSVSDSDAAIYSVTVSNLAGSVTSSNATLTVIDPPSITAQPLGRRILLGGGVSFSVSVSGTPPFSYQWRFNGTSLLDATNAAYAMQAIGTNNTGKYSVVVSNWAGSMTSSNALLTVMVPPTLGLQLWVGYPVLNLNGMLSNNFVVQYSTNPAGTNWMNLISLPNLSASPYLFLDSGGVGQPTRFYRAFMQ